MTPAQREQSNSGHQVGSSACSQQAIGESSYALLTTKRITRKITMNQVLALLVMRELLPVQLNSYFWKTGCYALYLALKRIQGILRYTRAGVVRTKYPQLVGKYVAVFPLGLLVQAPSCKHRSNILPSDQCAGMITAKYPQLAGEYVAVFPLGLLVQAPSCEHRSNIPAGTQRAGIVRAEYSLPDGEYVAVFSFGSLVQAARRKHAGNLKPGVQRIGVVRTEYLQLVGQDIPVFLLSFSILATEPVCAGDPIFVGPDVLVIEAQPGSMLKCGLGQFLCRWVGPCP